MWVEPREESAGKLIICCLDIFKDMRLLASLELSTLTLKGNLCLFVLWVTSFQLLLKFVTWRWPDFVCSGFGKNFYLLNNVFNIQTNFGMLTNFLINVLIHKSLMIVFSLLISDHIISCRCSSMKLKISFSFYMTKI